MGVGLFEYAEKHPEQQQEPQRQQEPEPTAQYIRDLRQIEALKDSINQQIEQGREPQYILYTAIRAIGLLTNDDEWEQRQRGALDAIYSDVAQESLFRDSEAAARSRRETLLRDYADKTRRQLTRQLNACRKLQGDLEAAINDVERLEPAGGLLE